MQSKAAKHIMLVEDDESLAEWFSDYLSENGYLVSLVTRGDLAIELIVEDQPDLVILDIMLPVSDGFDVCKAVRNSYQGPILMMTARDQETDEVLGLELGADDYVTKPVKPQVLLSRIKALFRRSQLNEVSVNHQSNCLIYGQFCLDMAARNVSLDGKKIAISSNEFDVLQVLANSPGQVVSRQALISELRGFEYDGFDRSVDILISRIRKKLGDHAQNPFRIKTVWGKGYLFVKDAW